MLRQVLRPGDEVVAVPSIAEEGRALFEAVASQGLLGIRARQRSSPYLPGVRSRMWRSVMVAGQPPDQPLVLVGAAEVGDALDVTPPRFERVLALIRRLPLEFDDDGPS